MSQAPPDPTNTDQPPASRTDAAPRGEHSRGPREGRTFIVPAPTGSGATSLVLRLCAIASIVLGVFVAIQVAQFAGWFALLYITGSGTIAAMVWGIAAVLDAVRDMRWQLALAAAAARAARQERDLD